MSNRRRLDANKGEAYRARITFEYIGDPGSPLAHCREDCTVERFHGPYVSPGPARAAITHATRRLPFPYGYAGVTVTGVVERSELVWAPVPMTATTTIRPARQP